MSTTEPHIEQSSDEKAGSPPSPHSSHHDTSPPAPKLGTDPFGTLFKGVRTHAYDEIRALLENVPSDNLLSANTVSTEGETPLLIAVQAGDLEMVDLLVSFGAKVDYLAIPDTQAEEEGKAYDPYRIWSPQDWVTSVNAADPKALEALLKDADRKLAPLGNAFSSREGLKRRYELRTPLMMAAQRGNLEMVKALKEKHHADDSIVAPDGHTAYSLALMGKHEEIMTYLPERIDKKKRWKYERLKPFEWGTRTKIERSGIGARKFFTAIPSAILNCLLFPCVLCLACGMRDDD